MLLAHLSDFHVFSSTKETAFVRDDAAAIARRVVADAASLDPALDGVILTGDLTDGGSLDDYRLLREILAPLTCPLVVIPGNHDRRAALKSRFRRPRRFHRCGLCALRATDRRRSRLGAGHIDRGACRRRTVSRARLAWVAAQLAESHHGPTLVAMHHPPFSTGIQALDAATLVEGAEEFRRLIIEAPGDIRILAGHIHRPVQARWAGRFAATAGSPHSRLASISAARLRSLRWSRNHMPISSTTSADAATLQSTHATWTLDASDRAETHQSRARRRREPRKDGRRACDPAFRDGGKFARHDERPPRSCYGSRPGGRKAYRRRPSTPVSE